MLLNRISMMSYKILENEGTHTHLIVEPDGSTVATSNGSLLFASPVVEPEEDFPLIEGNHEQLTGRLYIEKGTVAKMIKTIPRKTPLSILKNGELIKTSGGNWCFATTNLETETKTLISPREKKSHPLRADWRKSFIFPPEKVCTAPDQLFSVKKILDVLIIMKDVFPDSTAIKITQQGKGEPVVIKVSHPKTGQEMIGIIMPMEE